MAAPAAQPQLARRAKRHSQAVRQRQPRITAVCIVIIVVLVEYRPRRRSLLDRRPSLAVAAVAVAVAAVAIAAAAVAVAAAVAAVAGRGTVSPTFRHLE